jgi:hypothetical protein
VTICDIYVTHEVAVGHEVTVGDSTAAELVKIEY